MTLIIDNTTELIAQRVRLEREVRGWSQAELAAHAGVSKAAVSKIERGEVSPTAALLVRLAGAFDLTLAGLLLRAEGEGGRLIRADEQPLWQDPGSGYRRTQVFMRPDHPLELVRVELPAGRRVTLPASSYAQIRQVVLVQSGELTLLEGQERHELHAGDCLGFGPPCEVTFVNGGEVPCTYLVALARR
ncbi:helix-turn-helix domain-containing protein [Deinococcus altitudinis]|uniref:helix-turn-helix domain-containing protein n=1 Tax=Deinococcus altitudinis TaxID=468914 RepID=UPI0038928978